MTKKLKISFLALSLVYAGLIGEVLAAGSHSHEGETIQSELRLNNGAKWQGDSFMKQGMDAIHALIAAKKPEIHNKVFDQKGYGALAASINDQINFMAQNCYLPEAVDEQFHIVLGDVVDGVEMMETGQQSRAGAIKVIVALNTYGKFFNHPGWKFF